MAVFRSLVAPAGFGLALFGGAFVGSIFAPGINHGPDETAAQAVIGAIGGAIVGACLWMLGCSLAQVSGMQFRLRTLLIVLAVAPLVLAAIAFAASYYLTEYVIVTEWK